VIFVEKQIWNFVTMETLILVAKKLFYPGYNIGQKWDWSELYRKTFLVHSVDPNEKYNKQNKDDENPHYKSAFPAEIFNIFHSIAQQFPTK